MPVSFNVNGAGFKGARVPSVEAGLVGYYGANGKPYAPHDDAVRELVPPQWRRAYDRAVWWWPDNGKPAQAYRALHDTRGRYLTTVYANAVEG